MILLFIPIRSPTIGLYKRLRILRNERNPACPEYLQVLQLSVRYGSSLGWLDAMSHDRQVRSLRALAQRLRVSTNIYLSSPTLLHNSNTFILSL